MEQRLLEHFSDSDIISLGVIVKANKFQGFNTILYPANPVDSLKNFVNCYKLMMTVPNETRDMALKNKVQLILKDYIELYKEANFYVIKLSGSVTTMSITKVNRFYVQKSYDIEKFISFVYPLGKIVKVFDVDEEVGVY